MTTDYTTIRHQLHLHPQTAGNEQYAHDTIVAHLQRLHPSHLHTHVGGWGVVAVWGSNPSLPTIALRADTDALPSGHLCGHDGHTTALLRLAEIIDHSTHPSHNILLLWQPAEETGQGAQSILDSHVLQQYNIVRFFAMHNIPGIPLGDVVVCPNTFAQASTGIIYHLVGRQTHASTPELGLNPGLAVADTIQCLAQLAPAGGTRQATLICVRLGQPAFGTSAGQADVMFTLRSPSNDDMQLLLHEADQAVSAIAQRHGLALQTTMQEPFCATENSPRAVDEIKKAAALLPLNINLQPNPFRWSEDFGRLLMHYEGAMFGMGSGCNQPELHHPDFDYPDPLIDATASMFAALIDVAASAIKPCQSSSPV